jgi:hypothetical protein
MSETANGFDLNNVEDATGAWRLFTSLESGTCKCRTKQRLPAEIDRDLRAMILFGVRMLL